MATSRAPGQTSSSRPTDSRGTTGPRLRPVTGRAGGPDSGSGGPGTGDISASVPHRQRAGAVAAPRPENWPGHDRRGAAAGPVGGGVAAPAPPRVTTVTRGAITGTPTTVPFLLRRGDF